MTVHPVSPAPVGYYDVNVCAACGDRTSPLERMRVGDYMVMACVNPKPCIARAKAAGIWAVIPR